jgi:hypothetical protein
MRQSLYYGILSNGFGMNLVQGPGKYGSCGAGVHGTGSRVAE